MKTDPLIQCYEMGRNAGWYGDGKQSCTLRRADKRNAWLRGYDEGEHIRTQPKLTNEQKARNRAQVQKLKDSLATTGGES